MPLWEELTTTDFAGLDPARTIAVLPVAAIEQHGPHLPLGTDAILCDAILDRAIARLPQPDLLLRLPTQRIGLSPEHASFPGTLTLSPATLLAFWAELGLSVAAAGVRKLVLFNTHGGQGSLVDVAAQALRGQAGMLVVRSSSYRFALPDGWIPAEERRYGLHGGLIETAMMLAAAPHLVRLAAVRTFPSRATGWEEAVPGLQVEGESGLAWCAEDLNPAGATGNAAAASAGLSARIGEHYATRLAQVIEAARMLAFPPGPGTSAPQPSSR
jgi:creatinine amidohydrolase